MEDWSNEEVEKLGDFVKEHGIPDGAEDEIINLVKKFANVCNNFGLLSGEEKGAQRKEFCEAQKVFFRTGSVFANLFAPDQNEEGASNIEMVPIEPDKSAGAIPKTTKQVSKEIPKEPLVKLPWLPYVYYRKILQPALELEIGQLTNNTMGDMYHAIEQAKQRAAQYGISIVYAEQALMAIVHFKFDPITRGIWEFQLGTMEPVIGSMERFLEQRSNMIQEELGPPTPVSESEPRRKQSQCIYCKSTTHTIYKCVHGFESLTIQAKKAFLRKEERCDNCFMRHPTDVCTGGSCWTCKVQHNSMLCPKNPKNL